jgi:hypothetical protein
MRYILYHTYLVSYIFGQTLDTLTKKKHQNWICFGMELVFLNYRSILPIATCFVWQLFKEGHEN